MSSFDSCWPIQVYWGEAHRSRVRGPDRPIILGLLDPRSISYPRSNGPSVYRTCGLSDPRSQGPVVYRTLFRDPHLSSLIFWRSERGRLCDVSGSRRQHLRDVFSVAATSPQHLGSHGDVFATSLAVDLLGLQQVSETSRSPVTDKISLRVRRCRNWWRRRGDISETCPRLKEKRKKKKEKLKSKSNITNSPGSCGDVFATSLAVAATSLRRLLSCGNVSATSPAVTATSSQHLRQSWRCLCDVFGSLLGLQQVLETSPQSRTKISLRDRRRRNWWRFRGDVFETCWRLEK